MVNTETWPKHTPESSTEQVDYNILTDKSQAYEKHAQGKISPNDFRAALSIYKDEIFVNQKGEWLNIGKKLNDKEINKTAEQKLNGLVSALAHLEQQFGEKFLNTLLYGTESEDTAMNGARKVTTHIPLDSIIALYQDVEKAQGNQVEDVAHYLSKNQYEEGIIRWKIAGYKKNSSLSDIYDDSKNEVWFEASKLNEKNKKIMTNFVELVKNRAGIDIWTDFFESIREKISWAIYGSIMETINQQGKKLDAGKKQEIATYISGNFNEVHEHNLAFAMLHGITKGANLLTANDWESIANNLSKTKWGKEEMMNAIFGNETLQKAFPWIGVNNKSPLRNNIKSTISYVSENISHQYDSEKHGEINLSKWLRIVKHTKKAKNIIHEKNANMRANTETFNILFNNIDTSTAFIEACMTWGTNYSPENTIQTLAWNNTTNESETQQNTDDKKNEAVLTLQEQNKSVNIEPTTDLINAMDTNIDGIHTNTKKWWITKESIQKMSVDIASDKVNWLIDQVFQNETVSGVLEFFGVNRDTIIWFLDPTNNSLLAKIVQFFMWRKLKNYGLTTTDIFNNLKNNNETIEEQATEHTNEYTNEIKKSNKAWEIKWLEAKLFEKKDPNIYTPLERTNSIDHTQSTLIEKISADIYPKQFLKSYDESPLYPTAFLESHINKEGTSEKIATQDLMKKANETWDKEDLMDSFISWKIKSIMSNDKHPFTKATEENPFTWEALIKEIYRELEYGKKQQTDMEAMKGQQKRKLHWNSDEGIARIALTADEIKSNQIFYIDNKTWAKHEYDHKEGVSYDGNPIVFQLVPKGWKAIKNKKKAITLLWDPTFVENKNEVPAVPGDAAGGDATKPSKTKTNQKKEEKK